MLFTLVDIPEGPNNDKAECVLANNVFAPNKRRAIMWINGCLFFQPVNPSFDIDEVIVIGEIYSGWFFVTQKHLKVIVPYVYTLIEPILDTIFSNHPRE